MPKRGLLEWIAGAGWLIFSGGEADGSPLRAQALTRVAADGQVIYISLAADEGEALQEDLEDLGASAGYILDVRHESAADSLEQLTSACLVVIESGENVNALYAALQGAPLQGIQAAYERGAVILIEGLAANLFGKWVLSDEGEVLEGLDWIKSAFLEPGVTAAGGSRAVQAILRDHPQAIAVEIGDGSALVFGGAGEIEIWGAQQVTISLGSAYPLQS
jgi:hypothetical protein